MSVSGSASDSQYIIFYSQEHSWYVRLPPSMAWVYAWFFISAYIEPLPDLSIHIK